MASTLELLCDGNPVLVQADDALVGRTPQCTIRIVHPLVSREHCRIEVRRDGVYVDDLGSMNGTWVNGRRIAERTRLVVDDRIGLGREGAVLVLKRALLDGTDVSLRREEDMKTMVAGDPRALGAVPRVEVAHEALPALGVADEPPTAGMAPTREVTAAVRLPAPAAATGPIPVVPVVESAELRAEMAEDETLPIPPTLPPPRGFWHGFAIGAAAAIVLVTFLASCTPALDGVRGLLRGSP
jgi:predicted component of type VI protein secretion system